MTAPLNDQLKLVLARPDGTIIHTWTIVTELDVPDAEDIAGMIPTEEWVRRYKEYGS